MIQKYILLFTKDPLREFDITIIHQLLLVQHLVACFTKASNILFVVKVIFPGSHINLSINGS